MRNIFIHIIKGTFLLLYLPGFSQLAQKGDIGTDSLPAVTFSVHSRNPDLLPQSAFTIKDAEKSPEFLCIPLGLIEKSLPKNVLILWEYLPHASRKDQNEYIRKLIINSIPSIFANPADKVAISTFAWTDQPGDIKCLKFLTDGFVSDSIGISDSLRNAKSPIRSTILENHGSALYETISEGTHYLSENSPPGSAKVLLIFSAEFPNIYNPSKDLSIVIGESRKMDVSVYNFRYKLMDEKYNLKSLARESYGLSYDLVKTDPAVCMDTISNFLLQSGIRALGRDYRFICKTDFTRDGKSHSLVVANGLEQMTITFVSPGLGLLGWIQKNPFPAGGIGLFVIMGATVLVILIRKRKKQEEVSKKANEKKIREMDDKGRLTEAAMLNQQQELVKIKNAEQQRIQNAENLKNSQAAEEEAAQLLKEMFMNNRNPRLIIQSVSGGQPAGFTSPVVTVGRDVSNEIQINHATVSRHHFQIVYSSGKYVLQDLGSSNGTFVNDVKVEQNEIRHGDIIRSGDVTMNFYQ